MNVNQSVAEDCRDRYMVPREHVMGGSELVREVREGFPEKEAVERYLPGD